VPYTDFGARQYNTALRRWMTPDPLSEKYYGISPYAFCAGNPVVYIDYNGESIGKVVKVGKKVYKTIKTGKKLNLKNILKSEVIDIADNVRTIFSEDATWFERGFAVIDLATGFGDEAKWLAKTVGVSDGIVDGAKAADDIKFKSFTPANKAATTSKLRETVEIGQEAHRQIEKELIETVPGIKTEVKIKLGDRTVVKDGVKLDGTVVILKPDTPSGHMSATRRAKLMQANGFKTETMFYDPKDKRWLPDSPSYIGPKKHK